MFIYSLTKTAAPLSRKSGPHEQKIISKKNHKGKSAAVTSFAHSNPLAAAKGLLREEERNLNLQPKLVNLQFL